MSSEDKFKLVEELVRFIFLFRDKMSHTERLNLTDQMLCKNGIVDQIKKALHV
jgi:hypothetical protein